MKEIIVATQADLNAELAKKTRRRVIIEASHATPLVIGPTGSHILILSRGTVQRVWSGGTVQEVWSGGTVQRLDAGAVIVRAEAGARILRAAALATVYAYGRVIVEGGNVIDMAALDQKDPQAWCDLHGVEVIDGEAVLYKALDADLRSPHDNGDRIETIVPESMTAPHPVAVEADDANEGAS